MSASVVLQFFRTFQRGPGDPRSSPPDDYATGIRRPVYRSLIL